MERLYNQEDKKNSSAGSDLESTVVIGSPAEKSRIVLYRDLLSDLEKINNPFDLERFLEKEDENGEKQNMKILLRAFPAGIESDDVMAVVRDCQKPLEKATISAIHSFLSYIKSHSDLRNRFIRALQLPEEVYSHGYEVRSENISPIEVPTIQSEKIIGEEKEQQLILSKLEKAETISEAISIMGDYVEDEDTFKVNDDFKKAYPWLEVKDIIARLRVCKDKRENCSASLRLLKGDFENRNFAPSELGRVLFRIVEKELHDAFQEKDKRDAEESSGKLKDAYSKFDSDQESKMSMDDVKDMFHNLRLLSYAKGFSPDEYNRVQEQVNVENMKASTTYDLFDKINHFVESTSPSEEILLSLMCSMALFGYLKGVDEKGEGLLSEEVIEIIKAK